MIQGLHHSALRCCGVEEQERALDFYCKILGMKPVRSWGEGRARICLIDTGNGGLLELFADAEAGRKPGQVDHIALATDDVDGNVAKAVQYGLSVLIPPTSYDVPAQTTWSIRFAYILGPIGEIIEFIHEK